MALDAELLSRNNQSSSQRAGNLNRARRSSSNNNSQDSDLGVYHNFYAARHAARAKRNSSKMAGASGSMVAIKNSPQLATNELLKQAWLNLIDSYGLTLLWINIHVFLSQVFGKKLFRKLKLWESMLLGALDVLVLVVITMVLGFIYLVVTGQGVILVLKGLLGPLWGIFSK